MLYQFFCFYLSLSLFSFSLSSHALLNCRMWACSKPKRYKLCKGSKRSKGLSRLADDLCSLILQLSSDSLQAWAVAQSVNQQFRRCALKSRALTHLPVILQESSQLERLGSTRPGINMLMLAHVDSDLSSSMANLTSLRHLSLALPPTADTTWRPRLDVCNESLAALSSRGTLQSLRLDGCLEISEVTSLAGLTKLLELSLKRCPVLELAPLASLPLRELMLDYNHHLTNLSPLGSMSTLRHISLQWCEMLPDDAIESLVGLKQLRSMDLSHCTTLSTAGLCALSALSGLKILVLNSTQADDKVLQVLCASLALEQLCLDDCLITNTGLRALASQRSLWSLDLNGCNNITDLEPVATLKSLQKLGLCECYNISDQSLTHLSDLVLLQELDLCNTDVSEGGLSALHRLPSLRVLDLGEQPLSGVGLRAIGSLTSLEKVTLSVSVSDADMQAVACLTGLRSLDLSVCKVTDIGLRPLTALKKLHTLNLSGLPITDTGLKALARMGSLTSVDLTRCDRITGSGVWELERLDIKVLTLAGCGHVYFPGGVMPRFTNLRVLNVQQVGIHMLRNHMFTGVLEKLDVSSCTTDLFEDLDSPSCLPALRILRMSRWRPVGRLTLQPLGYLPKLRILDLSYTRVTDEHISVLAPFPLSTLNLSDCAAITDEGLRALATSRTLTSLNVSNCDLITDVGLQLLSRSTLRKLDCSSCDRVTAIGVNAACQRLQLKAEYCLGANEVFDRVVAGARAGLEAAHHFAENKLVQLSMLAFALRPKTEHWFFVEAKRGYVSLYVEPQLSQTSAMRVNVLFKHIDWEFIVDQFSKPVDNVHRQWYFFKEQRRRRVWVHARPLLSEIVSR